MARPIALELPPRDPRRELQAKLEAAPLNHAEALLDGYELLQQMRDGHVFDILRGVLEKGEKIIEVGADAAKDPDSIRGMRNFMILTKMFASVDPPLLQGVASAMHQTVQATRNQPAEPPSLLALLGRLRSKEVRRALGLMTGFLASLGSHIPADKS